MVLSRYLVNSFRASSTSALLVSTVDTNKSSPAANLSKNKFVGANVISRKIADIEVLTSGIQGGPVIYLDSSSHIPLSQGKGRGCLHLEPGISGLDRGQPSSPERK